MKSKWDLEETEKNEKAILNNKYKYVNIKRRVYGFLKFYCAVLKDKLKITHYTMYQGLTVKRRRKKQMQKIKGTGYTLDKKQEHIYTFHKNTIMGRHLF